MVQMRKLCPNFDREDGLETVLEVPIPEEMLTRMGNNPALRWQNMRMLMKCQGVDMRGAAPWNSGHKAELQLLLNVVGSPLVPLPIQTDQSVPRPIKDISIVSPPSSIDLLYSLNVNINYGCMHQHKLPLISNIINKLSLNNEMDFNNMIS